jgi:hypothetical protein
VTLVERIGLGCSALYDFYRWLALAVNLDVLLLGAVMPIKCVLADECVGHSSVDHDGCDQTER